MLSPDIPMWVVALATAGVVFLLSSLAREFHFVNRPGGRDRALRVVTPFEADTTYRHRGLLAKRLSPR